MPLPRRKRLGWASPQQSFDAGPALVKMDSMMMSNFSGVLGLWWGRDIYGNLNFYALRGRGGTGRVLREHRVYCLLLSCSKNNRNEDIMDGCGMVVMSPEEGAFVCRIRWI